MDITLDSTQYITEAKILDWVKKKFNDFTAGVRKFGMRSGEFYLMEYDSKLYEENEIDYYDHTPLILCLGKSGNYLLGLNINYLTKAHKKRLMKRLNDRYPKQFDKNKALPNLQWKNISKEMDNIRMDFIVKLYLVDRIKKPVKVETEDIDKMAQIDLSTWRGINLRQVWQAYRQGLKPNILPEKQK